MRCRIFLRWVKYILCEIIQAQLASSKLLGNLLEFVSIYHRLTV